MLMRMNKLKSRSLSLLLLMLLPGSVSISSQGISPLAADSSPGKPLVIYYSRLGTTRTVAREMAQNLKCEIEEIISNENRHGLWTVNCVFDQLLDRDDDVVPLYHDVTAYNPVIIAGPIWIHRFATPLRTILKSMDLPGKDIYVVVTNQGNYSEKDENNVRNSLKERGAHIRGYAGIMTRDKTENDLKQETRRVLEDLYNIFPALKPTASR